MIRKYWKTTLAITLPLAFGTILGGCSAGKQSAETLTASLSLTRASRDHWQHEAERLIELVASVPPWWLLWRRCLEACRALRKAAAVG